MNLIKLENQPRHRSPALIAHALLMALQQAMRYLNHNLKHRPPGAFDLLDIAGRKVATRLDVGAEEIAKATFWNYSKGALKDAEIFAEESLYSGLDINHLPGLVGLFDALDGTDNFLRYGSHFASTGTILDLSLPEGSRLIATCAVMPTGCGYVWDAQADSVRVFESNRVRPARGTSGRTLLPGAALAAVAQKDHGLEFLGEVSRTLGTALALRYGLAGMPIIPSFLDVGHGSPGIDVVTDGGQLPHDSAPLLWMALKVGAAVLTPQGQQLQLIDIEKSLMKPADNRLRYIAAASHDLAFSVVSTLEASAQLMAA